MSNHHPIICTRIWENWILNYKAWRSWPLSLLESSTNLSIKAVENDDPWLVRINDVVKQSGRLEFRMDDHGIFWLEKRLYVPVNKELKEEVTKEAYDSIFFMYLSNTKMHIDLRKIF